MNHWCSLYQVIESMSRSKSNSSMRARTTALTILARIIAKDMLSKSMSGEGPIEVVARTPDRRLGEYDENTNDESRSN